ncbi:hypothetical protein HK096_006280 [Nowakowskiella sp. JEL0078]|nr:hypothetical protein HK096_006280 [Nowakowskiella sp. JEL0078]
MSIFNPLKLFIDSAIEELGETTLPRTSQTIVMWKEEVVEQTAQRFVKELNEMMTRLRKTEESLKRFNKGKKVSMNTTEAGTSMEEKIQRQIQLDVKQIRAQMEALEVTEKTLAIIDTLLEPENK